MPTFGPWRRLYRFAAASALVLAMFVVAGCEEPPEVELGEDSGTEEDVRSATLDGSAKADTESTPAEETEASPSIAAGRSADQLTTDAAESNSAAEQVDDEGVEGDADEVVTDNTDPPEEPRPRAEALDLQELLIDSAPIAEREPSIGMANALASARKAMRERNFLGTRQELESAAAFQREDGDRAAYERMIRLHALWSLGWSHASIAARGLEPGDKIETWIGPALVQDKTDSEMLLRLDGRPQTFGTRIGEMDVRLAATLIAHRAAETGLSLDAHRAAVLALDREWLPEAVREACVEAAQRGAYIDPVLAELRQREQQEPSGG